MRIILSIFLCFLSLTAEATTVTFQQGVNSYTGGKSVYINSANQNEHATGLLYVNPSTEYMAILDFDISAAAIPSSATIISAFLTPTIYETNTTGTISAGRILDPSSTGVFTEAGIDTDTFNNYSTWRYKDEATTTRWQTGGTNLNITDVLNTADDTFAPDLFYTGTHDYNVTSSVSTIVAASGSHVMLYLRGNTGANQRMRSNYFATTTDRPLLTITYTASAPTTSNNGINQVRLNGSWQSK